ncbi:MAG: AsmA family protein, partial [Phyllobacteriaceae bacterium]|nr:AsmA family protein [Phyllobacteriaceae bacterium]
MSVWKSPVFYFGLLLLALISVLLAAPYVVSWNGYKDNLEAYGRRLTGRNVEIGGDVEIRLFPWPRLTAQRVAIGNPEGFDGAPLIHSEVVTLSLQLGGLLNGALNVDSVELQEPQVTLIRNGDGAVNWMLSSDEDLRRSTLLSNVRLDQIHFSNAAIRFDDRKQGIVTDLSTIDADMSAAAIEGPWRLKGTGNWREMPMAFTFSSSAYEKGGPFKFGLRVTPGDTVLPGFSIDGGWQDGAFDGDVSVTPQAADGQKSSVEGGFRPLAMKAKLKASTARADLSEIRIAPADAQDSSTLIEGSAGVDLGNVMRGDIKLKSPRANLDMLLGAESLATWRSGGLLALGHSLMRHLPQKLDTRFALDLTVLTAGGETMNDVRLAAHITADGIRIEKARASLPGRSAVQLVDGMVLRKDGAAELAGQLAFESSDLRAFAGWALPQRKAGFESWWKGSRGRLKLKSGVSWTQSQLTLQNVEYELESLPGQGELTLRQGQVPSLDINVRTPARDLDSFFAVGSAAVSGSRAFDVLGFLDPVLRGAETLEKHITLDAGAVTLNGVRTQDVALDVATSQSGFEIKAFDIGSVGGARLKAEGLVLSGADGPSGDVTASLVANDPSGFLRLAGLSASKATWIRALGQTDVAFKFNGRPDPNGPVLTYTLNGTSAPFTLALAGGITELERGSDARITLDGTVTAPDAARLLAVAGVTAKVQGAGAGKVTLGFSGARGVGFASKLVAEAYGARLSFDGSLKPQEPYAAISGAASLFADDVGSLLRAMGVPQADGAGGALRLAFKVVPEDGGLAISDVVGDHAGLALAGEGKFDRDGKLAADFNTGDTSLLRLLALTFAPWDGDEVDLGTAFARPENLLFDGEIWLRPRTLAMPFGDELKETAIGITLGKTRRLSLLAPTMPEL